MLIDAHQPEETRVVLLNGNKIEEFDYENNSLIQLKGNVYLARVTRVEPSLQAAFVEYGGNRQGFLALSEIHPDYYRIPIEDREALTAQTDSENEQDSASEQSENILADTTENNSPEEIGGDDEHDSRSQSSVSVIRQYKIQEVITRKQILLVQVVKEERGNKGAALTTYPSLAGRYCVLMPNTARGGGISRKITNLSDRKKLKEIANEIDVPTGAGLIVRTAGAKRTKTEIKRDYEYLQRLWEQIRELTLKSIAPSKIYEEGDLIKRSIRDLYNRDIEEVLVEGERGFKNAKDFMKMIMPSHTKNVKHYDDGLPLFARYQVESYLSAMFNPVVQLRSGGYIVIGITEALVAIDVNSGRATKEGSIEDTALKTNLEAADEISRQLRLRDLAGLIVIDFIDMDERKNNANVEKRIKDKLKSDRARIQVGRISGFGLLEMSRQRLRPGMLEATTQSCPSCHGTGLIRSDDNLALSILRQIEEEGVRKRSQEVLVKCPVSIANFIMNQKREYIASIEKNYGLSVRVEGDLNLVSPEYSIEKLKSATRILTENEPVLVTADGLMEKFEEDETEDFQIEDERPKKRRRRRRKKRQFTNEEEVKSDQDETGKQGNSETGVENIPSSNENTPAENVKKDVKRRRRNKQSNEKQEVITVSVIESTEEKAVGGKTEVKSTDKLPKEEKEKKKRAPRKSKKVDLENSDEPKLNDEEEQAKQKRRGWWSIKG